MRGIFVCLALGLVFVGTGGLCVGYATAQFNLGCSYEKGEGIDKDRKKSLYWYGKAARQGDADAQARLEAF